MDDNTMRLVDQLLEKERELTELREMKKYLVNVLWNAELKDANESKKYNGKYGEKITDTKVRVCDVRAVFGIMPNPEAIAVYKSIKEGVIDDGGDTE